MMAQKAIRTQFRLRLLQYSTAGHQTTGNYQVKKRSRKPLQECTIQHNVYKGIWYSTCFVTGLNATASVYLQLKRVACFIHYAVFFYTCIKSTRIYNLWNCCENFICKFSTACKLFSSRTWDNYNSILAVITRYRPLRVFLCSITSC